MINKPPGKRRHGRELAVQFLFVLDHNRGPLEQTLASFLGFQRENGELLFSNEPAREFGEKLIRGVVEHWDVLDQHIKDATANFNLQRIGGIERAVLRLGIYEMFHCLDVPPVVAINEAVDVAKKFVGDDAGRFVNGVLDRIRHSLKRPARTAAAPTDFLDQQMARAAQELGESAGPDTSSGSTPPPPVD